MYTKSGRLCKNWSKEDIDFYPALGDHNYCRNHDGDDNIWCYTTDVSQEWEYCEPAPCSTEKRVLPHEVTTAALGQDYRGF